MVRKITNSVGTRCAGVHIRIAAVGARTRQQGEDSGDRYFPRQGSQHFGPRHDLPGGKTEALSSA